MAQIAHDLVAPLPAREGGFAATRRALPGWPF
jgi:hypothetical protein